MLGFRRASKLQLVVYKKHGRKVCQAEIAAVTNSKQAMSINRHSRHIMLKDLPVVQPVVVLSCQVHDSIPDVGWQV